MKDEELLARAVREVRDVDAAAPAHVTATRARIEMQLHARARTRRRSRRKAWILAAAALTSATAFAAGRTVFRGGVLGPSTNAVEETGAVAAPIAKASRVGGAAKAKSIEAARPKIAHVEPPADAPIEVAPPPPRPRVSGADELYTAAHDAHFRQRDPARALAAWDAYLAVAPQDPRAGFTLEARYNRAICLVRLGRITEAREALRPFAEGAYGDYRRRDAQTLLDEYR